MGLFEIITYHLFREIHPSTSNPQSVWNQRAHRCFDECPTPGDLVWIYVGGRGAQGYSSGYNHGGIVIECFVCDAPE